MTSSDDTSKPLNMVWDKIISAFGLQSTSLSASKALMFTLITLFEELADEFNASVAEEALKITVLKPDTTSGGERNARYDRLIVSSSFWTLSIRAVDAIFEFFLIPSCELPNLEQGELASRAKLRLTFSDGEGWCMDGLPVSDTELNTLARSLLKDLIVRSQGDYELLPESTRLVHGGLSLTRSVRSLVAERHALVQKIVNQQESILSQVARDLHDAVLGNVMLLERSIASGKQIPDEELKRLLHEISTNLREVCHDIYPRDLKDLGLPLLLEEMCSSFTRKTNLATQFTCRGELPDLPDEVALHIYRIAQECFNNIGKHAAANKVELVVTIYDGILSVKICDDGKGFDIDSIKGKGGGTSIIKERSELINCLFPSKVSFESSSEGTNMNLEIRYSAEST